MFGAVTLIIHGGTPGIFSSAPNNFFGVSKNERIEKDGKVGVVVKVVKIVVVVVAVVDGWVVDVERVVVVVGADVAVVTVVDG